MAHVLNNGLLLKIHPYTLPPYYWGLNSRLIKYSVVQAPIIKTRILSSRMRKQLYPSAKRIHCEKSAVSADTALTLQRIPPLLASTTVVAVSAVIFQEYGFPIIPQSNLHFYSPNLNLMRRRIQKNNTGDEQGKESKRDSITTAAVCYE